MTAHGAFDMRSDQFDIPAAIYTVRRISCSFAFQRQFVCFDIDNRIVFIPADVLAVLNDPRHLRFAQEQLLVVYGTFEDCRNSAISFRDAPLMYSRKICLMCSASAGSITILPFLTVYPYGM